MPFNIDTIIAFDHSLAQTIASARTPEVIQLFIWITELGISSVFIPVCIVVVIMFCIAKRKWLILPLATSVIGSLIVTMTAKFIYQRPRPLDGILIEQSYSFPSGHATIAVSLYGFLVYLLTRNALTRSAQFSWMLIGLLVIFAIGFSRIVLGVHYLSDVLAGYLVGGIWLTVGIYISEIFISKGKVIFNIPLPAKNIAYIYGLCTLTVLSYGLFALLYTPPLAQLR